jgi:urate oxidase
LQVDASAGKDKLVGKVTSGIADLLGRTLHFCTLNILINYYYYYPVLKTSGSAFENFIKDEYTTLVPVNDRIFSTSVDLSYTFSPVPLSPPKDEKKLEFSVPDGADLVGGTWDGEGVAERARKITLDVFATDDSASVQVRAGFARVLKISADPLHPIRPGYALQDGPGGNYRESAYHLRHLYLA